MATIWVQPSPRKKGAWTVGKVGYPVETRKSKRGAISWAKGMAQAGDEIKISENPSGESRFDRCVRDVKAKGSAYDPRAVCAAAGRKKYGQAEMTRRAVAGKRRAARANAGVGSWYAFDRRFQTKKQAYDYAQKMANREGHSVVVYHNDAMFATVRPSHHNPADAAAEAYQIFHGEPPSRFTTVTEKRHEHRYLASIGTLESLSIRAIDKQSIVKLSKFRGAYLAVNEQAFKELAKNGKVIAQLFIKDGDQSVNPEDFGIDPDRIHEVETLGKAIDVDYETNKIHLGDEGGEAVYHHKFRRTREGDAEVKVHWARYPDVIYRVLDQRLEFSGGSYELRAEGIDK